ncbi:Uncharacterized protein LW93_503 [Fusarium fujikuroi]|nr:Uncharacterized protein LW93_503 [Fusarium fujikuroi]
MKRITRAAERLVAQVQQGAYCGQSIDPPKRLGQHVQSLESKSPSVVVHHKIGRRILGKGGQMRMFPITFIEKSAKDHSVLWAWTELTLIVLFECFNPYMLTIDAYKQLPDEPSEAALSSDREAFHKTWSAPLAKRFVDVGREVKNSSPALKKFQLAQLFTGCNWSVPILERSFIDANLWVQTTTLDEVQRPHMYQFRTHPKRLQKNRQIILFIGKRSKEAPTVPRAFKVPIPATEFPTVQPGSIVNVVIEIMANAEDKHLYPWLEIPPIGPFDCWTEAMRVGIRIEYLDDDGQWKARYLFHTQHSPFTEHIKALKPAEYGNDREFVECLEVGWLHCMKVMTALLKWNWQPHQSMLAKRVFISYNGRVRKYDLDFFNQRIVLSDASTTNRDLPRLRTLEETSDLIETTFGHDVHIGYLPGPELMWDPQQRAVRKTCDLCRMGNRSMARGGGQFNIALKCVHNQITVKEGKPLVQCKFSAALRRYCTFTANIDDSQDLYRDLTYHMRRHPYPLHVIPEPANAIQILEQKEDDYSGPPVDDAVEVEAD